MTHDAGIVEGALDDAARAGFRLMLLGRSVVLAIMTVWLGAAYVQNDTLSGPFISASSLMLGLAVLATLGSRAERQWHRFAIVAVDIATVAGAAMFVPLLAAGGVPQWLVFRAYGMHLLWFAPVFTALALSPWLTAFAGLAAGSAIWVVYAVVTAPMTRTLSWSDLPDGPSGADYVALILSPDFIGRGNRIEESVSIALGGLLLALAVHRARDLVTAHAVESARRQRVETVFGRHVPQAVAESLLARPDAFPPSAHEATALHLDAAGFTAYAAGRDPAEVLETLDGMLATASQAIGAQGGVVVSFGGDSLLAVFGAPIQARDHAEQAVAAAQTVLTAMQTAPLRVRIGLASGPMAAGLVGGASRQAFTVYGETVNLAQRLEQACKQTGDTLLMAASTAAALHPSPPLRHVVLRDLPGLAQPVDAYTLAPAATRGSWQSEPAMLPASDASE